MSGWTEIVAGWHQKLNVALPSKHLHSLYVILLYIHTQNSTVFVYLLTPWGKTIGPEVLYESIVHSSSGWPLISPIGILLPPIICHWGPHGGKFPHRLDIGAPIGAPMGPHGVPHGAPLGAQWGPISPMGAVIFSYPILKGKNPTQKIVAFCVGCHGPLLCSWEVCHSSCQRLQSYAW